MGFRLSLLVAAAACIAPTLAFAPGAVSLSRSPALATSQAPARTAAAPLGLRMAAPVGSPAPSFSLPSSKGTTSLTDFKGKWVVLYFYPKVFTQGCTCQAQSMEEEAQAIRALGAEIVGASTDPVDKCIEFSEAYKLSFPLLSDKDGVLAKQYDSAISLPIVGTFANRKTFIINPKGEVAYAFDKVDAKGAGPEVIEQLKKLKA